jgi:hypothetical protein
MVPLSMDTVEHEVDDLLADGAVAAAALGEGAEGVVERLGEGSEGVVERHTSGSTISLLVAWSSPPLLDPGRSIPQGNNACVREEVVGQTVWHGADLVKTYGVLVGIVVCVRTVTTVGGGPMVLSDGMWP